jgi:hypothetical protein
MSDKVEKVARDAAKKMFFGLDPIDYHDDSDTYLVAFGSAVKHIKAAIEAALSALAPAEREAVPVRVTKAMAREMLAKFDRVQMHALSLGESDKAAQESGMEVVLMHALETYASPRPEAVGEAVKAERERCAKIAKAQATWPDDDAEFRACNTVAEAIADAILAGEEKP